MFLKPGIYKKIVGFHCEVSEQVLKFCLTSPMVIDVILASNGYRYHTSKQSPSQQSNLFYV